MREPQSLNKGRTPVPGGIRGMMEAELLLFIQKSECEITPETKVQKQEGAGWFGSMGVLSDHRATWSGPGAGPGE